MDTPWVVKGFLELGAYQRPTSANRSSGRANGCLQRVVWDGGGEGALDLLLKEQDLEI